MSIFSKKTKTLSRLKMLKFRYKFKRATKALTHGNAGAMYDIHKYSGQAFSYAHSINAGRVKIPRRRLNATIKFLNNTLPAGDKEDFLHEPDSIRAIRILEKSLRDNISVPESAKKIAQAELYIKDTNENRINPDEAPSVLQFLQGMNKHDFFNEKSAQSAIERLQQIVNQKQQSKITETVANPVVKEQITEQQTVVVPEQPVEIDPNAQKPNTAESTDTKSDTAKPQWRELAGRAPGFISDILYVLTFGTRQKIEANKQKRTTKKQTTNHVTLSPEPQVTQPDSKTFHWQYAASFVLIITACGLFGNSSSVKNDSTQTNASFAPNSGVTYTIPYNLNQPKPVISASDAYRDATSTENRETRIKPDITKEQNVKSVKKSVTANSVATNNVNTDASDKFCDSRLNMFLGKAGKESLVNKIQKQMNEGNINIDKSISATQIAYAKCIYNKYGYKIDVLESAAKGQKLTSDQNNELANVVLLVGDHGTGVQKLAHEHRSARDIHEMCAPKKTQSNTVKPTKQTSEQTKEIVGIDTAYANAMRNYYDSKLDIIAGRKKDAVLSTIRNQFTNENIKFADNSITPERLAYVYFLYCEYGLKNAILESAIKDRRRMEPDEIAELTKIILMAGENGTGVQKIAQEHASARGVKLNNHSKFDAATRAQKLKFLATKYNWKHR